MLSTLLDRAEFVPVDIHPVEEAGSIATQMADERPHCILVRKITNDEVRSRTGLSKLDNILRSSRLH